MQIGQGTYSTVYKARDVINQKFVAYINKVLEIQNGKVFSITHSNLERRKFSFAQCPKNDQEQKQRRILNFVFV